MIKLPADSNLLEAKSEGANANPLDKELQANSSENQN